MSLLCYYCVTTVLLLCHYCVITVSVRAGVFIHTTAVLNKTTHFLQHPVYTTSLLQQWLMLALWEAKLQKSQSAGPCGVLEYCQQSQLNIAVYIFRCLNCKTGTLILLKIYFHWIIHTKANDSRMRCGINSRWHTTDKWTLGPCSTDICPQAQGRRNTQKKICTPLPDFPNMFRPFLRYHLQGY